LFVNSVFGGIFTELVFAIYKRMIYLPVRGRRRVQSTSRSSNSLLAREFAGFYATRASAIFYILTSWDRSSAVHARAI